MRPVGPVVFGHVGPNTATTGIPKADATCIDPESFVIIPAQPATSSRKSSSVVSPAKFLTEIPRTSIAVATCSQTTRSCGDPKTATFAPSLIAASAPASMNLSAAQIFAVPLAAPGLMPIHIPGSRSCPASANLLASGKRISPRTGTEVRIPDRLSSSR